MLNIPVSYRKGEEVQHFFFAFAAKKSRKKSCFQSVSLLK